MKVSKRAAPVALPALTSLRFFAALAIVIHHCNGVFWPAADLGPLDAGVSFFFVLSGFILTHVYFDVNGRFASYNASHTASYYFYTARIARIWPLHLVCLFLTIIFINVPEPFDLTVLLANAVMLHAWIPFDRYFFSYNYASWSISTELFFYLMLPLLLRISTWQRCAMLLFSLAIVLALALLSAAEHLPVWDTSGNQLSSTGLLYTNPLARFAEFLSGVICGVWWVKKTGGRSSSRSVGTVVECAAMVAFVLAFRFFLRGGATLSSSAWMLDASTRSLLSEWLSHVGLTPFAAVLIVVFAGHKGLLSQALSQRGWVFLGEISFALYLVHQISLRWLQQHGAQFTLPGFGLFIVGLIVLATILHLVIEKPARAWLMRRYNRDVVHPAMRQ